MCDLVLYTALFRRVRMAAAASLVMVIAADDDAVVVAVVCVCREQNVLADRLASMSMDIDTALFTILRKDDRGLHGLRLVARAARITKKSVSLTFTHRSSRAPPHHHTHTQTHLQGSCRGLSESSADLMITAAFQTLGREVLLLWILSPLSSTLYMRRGYVD